MLDRELRERWATDYERLRPIYEAAVVRFRERLPELLDELIEIFAQVEETDRLTSALALTAPHSEWRRLPPVESAVRGRASPSVLKETVLVALDGTTVWPRRQVIDPALFTPRPYDRRYSGDWWRDGAEAAEAKAAQDQQQQALDAEAAQKFWNQPNSGGR